MTDPAKGRLCLEYKKCRLSADDYDGVGSQCTKDTGPSDVSWDPRELLTMLRRAETCDGF